MNNKTSVSYQIEQVRKMLESGKPQQALDYLDRLDSNNHLIQNARGVCLMRLGQADSANQILRDLAFRGQICIPSDTSPLFAANYATTLLMKGYNQEALEILADLKPAQHPYIAALYDAAAEWKRGLTLFQRLCCRLKLYPKKPISLTVPPGGL